MAPKKRTYSPLDQMPWDVQALHNSREFNYQHDVFENPPMLPRQPETIEITLTQDLRVKVRANSGRKEGEI